MNTLQKSFISIAVLILTTTLATCTSPSAIPFPSGETISEERTVTEFTGISLAISADVAYAQSNKQKVILEGDPEDLKRINTEVENGVLKIFVKQFSFKSIGKVKVTISSKELNKIDLIGSGNFVAEQPVKTDHLTLSVSGSGDIRMKNITVRSLDGSISGSGSMDIAGNTEADKLQIDISGSGKINAENFTAREGDVKISGSGNCRVNITDFLKGAISGSGNIYYKGKSRVDIAISGSGKARAL